MEHSLIFCSDIGLTIFDDARFQRFYIIQSWYKSQMIPCVYALLTHKTKETYRNMIADLKDGAAKLKLKSNPVFVKKVCEKWKAQYELRVKLHFFFFNLDFKTT